MAVNYLSEMKARGYWLTFCKMRNVKRAIYVLPIADIPYVSNGGHIWIFRTNVHGEHIWIIRKQPDSTVLYYCLGYLASLPIQMMSAPLMTEDFWKNPCGLEGGFEVNDAVYPDLIKKQLDEVLHNAAISHLQIKDVKKYMLENFEGLEEDSLVQQAYDWLQPPPANKEYFETISRDESLKDIYYLLQKYAVAFSQMLKDQGDKAEYIEYLKDTKIKIVQLLCSLQLTLMSLNVDPHPDATVEVMSEELRTLGESGKIIRDFLIVRDYVRAIHYTKELLTFLNQ